MNMFERAARAKLRFASSVGDLTTEQLWDLPLTAKGEKPDLDKITREVHRELKDRDEVSFVDEKPDARKIELELRFEILKHVIEAKKAKKAEKAAAEKRAENAVRRQKLLEALSAKDAAAIGAMSEEDIKRELAALGA